MAPHGGRCQRHPTLRRQQTVGSRIRETHSVVFALMPLQQTGSKGFDSKGDKGGKGKLGKGWKGNRPSPYDMPARETWFARPGDKGKGKSKGKEKGRILANTSDGPRMPKLMLGLHYKCPTSGKSICFGHNLPGGCPNGKNNEAECDRGLHICSKCLGAHSYNQCPQRQSS